MTHGFTSEHRGARGNLVEGVLEPRVLWRAPIPSIPHRPGARRPRRPDPGGQHLVRQWLQRRQDSGGVPFALRPDGRAVHLKRSSLTVNHGTYYLDTSVTLDQQQKENFSNTFPARKT